MAVEPLRIRGVSHQMAVVVWRSVRPPHLPTFTQRNFSCVDLCTSPMLARGIGGLLRSSDFRTGSHQFSCKVLPLLLCQGRIRTAPETASNHEVAPIRSDRVAHLIVATYFIPTRSTRAMNRGSERRSRSWGSTFRKTMEWERWRYARSSHSSARSRWPSASYILAIS